LWLLFLLVTSLLVVSFTHWVYRWRNPKCNGKLPPGSLGLPLIGETIQFLIPSKSIDMTSFIKKRKMKYGKLFKTNLVGRPVVVSLDPDFNHYVLQQEGKLVELWYMDSFGKLLNSDVTAAVTGYIHKYLRNLVLNHFGPEALKGNVISQLEETIDRKLQVWSKLPEFEVKKNSASMIFDITARMMFGYESEKSGENIGEYFTDFLQGIISFPLDIPGTPYHNCKKNQKKPLKLITELLNERRDNPEIRKGDFLEQIVEDTKNHDFMTDEFCIFVMFGLLLASIEAISATLVLTIKYLSENPSVVELLEEEHEAILKNRENPDSGLTWNEYKSSMTYTHYVMKESLRMASVAPGILRGVVQDIHVDGYVIPKGWTLMVIPSAIQMNPDTYEDPLTFNPSRWKNIGANTTTKNFIPFGGGARTCAGAEFSKLLMGVFLHLLVTKYRWEKIRGGEVGRSPALGFGKGFYVKLSAKQG
ncbi:p450 domain-containing protein, partial [Cephalotus follicularis]